MKVLVTGAGGFIGSRLAKKLILEGHEVYGTIHDSPSQVEGMQIINADLTNSYDVISKSNYIILPGVGSFDICITSLRELRIDKAIYNALENGSKLLGICVGMQILSTYGYEYGKSNGLDIIKGNVERMDKQGCDLKLPHIGWNQIEIVRDSKISKDIENKHRFCVK